MASSSDSANGRNSASRPPASNGSTSQQQEPATATAAGGEEQQRQQKKRKKAARACNHCQTAHLTCDDNRPCLRCVKRGLGDTCQDGARKKAKYLRDIEDALVNAGKAVPTHFIHSPPSTSNADSNAAEDVGNTSTKPSSQRHGSNSSQRVAAQEHSTRQSSDISPGHHAAAASSSSQQQNLRLPTESPIQFTNPSLPTPTTAPHSTLHPSPSIEVPPSDDSIANNHSNNNNNNAHHSHLPPNAYSNTPSNILNFDSSSSAPSQLQPFNFFNDLNLGGLGGLGGGGHTNSLTSDFLTTNNNSANLEYAVLSSMLQNSGYGNTSPMGFTDTLSSNNNNTGNGHQRSNNSMSMYQGIFTGSDDYGTMSFGFPPAAFENTNSSNSNNNTGSGNNAGLIMISQGNNSPASINSFLPSANSNNNGTNQQQQQHMPSLQAPTNTFGALPIDHNWPTIASTLPNGDSNNNNNTGHQGHQQQKQHSHAHQPQNQMIDTNHHPQHDSSNSASYLQNAAAHLAKTKPTVSSTGVMKVEDVYKHINKPYNYLEAYHALIRYLQSHFENKSSVLRIIRSLAIYRPSIIALHMPLTQEDEIFVERSFQRTLIELEKLISFSGTPTLVWRRTGEIVLVGTEFTLLSEWRREDLLSRDRFTNVEGGNGGNNAATATTTATSEDGVKEKKLSKGKKRYIFEIFDQDSLVEYYESFAQHAFESSSATIMFTCSIVTPKGRKVPCTFGYNLKRDIFGLPQMIIGQFLPILTSADDPTT